MLANEKEKIIFEMCCQGALTVELGCSGFCIQFTCCCCVFCLLLETVLICVTLVLKTLSFPQREILFFFACSLRVA